MVNQSDRDKGMIVRIPPCYYIHVLDHTTNVTTVHKGPLTYVRKDNEQVTLGPEKMVLIPPRHYCCIENPVANKGSQVLFESNGQAKLRYGFKEIRLTGDPFPLYPGETISIPVTPLTIVKKNSALLVRALQDFEDGEEKRVAGDEWLFEGPGTYTPDVNVEIVTTVNAEIVLPNEALHMRAKHDCKDRDGYTRFASEEWLVRKCGIYLPGAYEEVMEKISAHILTEQTAIYVKALKSFKDQFGINRLAGEEWLVDHTRTESYIPDVCESVSKKVNLVSLKNNEYCVLENPMGEDGKIRIGYSKLIMGETKFFPHPGEIVKLVKQAYILAENEGLVLDAEEDFLDTAEEPPVSRKAGERWMVRGPLAYIPRSPRVSVYRSSTSYSLGKGEGIYVQNMKTGHVRIVTGENYLLEAHEELWSKQVPSMVAELLGLDRNPFTTRGDAPSAKQSGMDTFQKVVTYNVPHNTVVQIYDYTAKTARVVFGPELVMLHPDEQFTLLSLSGGRPKKPHKIKTIGLLLGPDFCTDIVTVETADHARLSLQLSYSWRFDVKARDSETGCKLFSIPDFVGDICKAIASKIRGAVASCPFDDFHKNSSLIIRRAVFGDDNVSMLSNPVNLLTITSVDIQSVEPVDQKTRDSLQKSVQLAIEITTKSQEAAAKQEAERLEQIAIGKLERQKITDEAEAEKARIELLKLRAEALSIESCGESKAEARGRAEAASIECEAAVHQAQQKVNALKIEADSELERLTQAREAELKYMEESNRLEVEKVMKLADIEKEKFKSMMDSLGQDTLTTISNSHLGYQVRLLESLGLKSTLITDGKSPINLLQTAQGLTNTGF